MAKARVTYGGQAVIEGVMIRGTRAMAIAVRRADGTIASTSRRLGGLSTSGLRRVPLLRGVLVLWETLALGMRALSWSAAVAANEVDTRGDAKPLGLGAWLGIAVSMLFGVVFFSHQVGSFLGVWLAGYLFETTGSFDAVWWISVALGLAAAIVHWPIDEKALDRQAMAGA